MPPLFIAVALATAAVAVVVFTLPRAEPAARESGWSVLESRSLDGASAGLSAASGSRRARLVVTCAEGDWGVTLHVGRALLGPRSYIRTRLDDEPWEDAYWHVVFQAGVVSYPYDAAAFARRLAEANRMEVESFAEQGPTATATFALVGAEDAVAEVEELCRR